jgi:hypothetical protein
MLGKSRVGCFSGRLRCARKPPWLGHGACHMRLRCIQTTMQGCVLRACCCKFQYLIAAQQCASCCTSQPLRQRGTCCAPPCLAHEPLRLHAHECVVGHGLLKFDLCLCAVPCKSCFKTCFAASPSRCHVTRALHLPNCRWCNHFDHVVCRCWTMWGTRGQAALSVSRGASLRIASRTALDLGLCATRPNWTARPDGLCVAAVCNQDWPLLSDHGGSLCYSTVCASRV